MDIKKLEEGIFVRNIKHGNVEKVLYLGLMKTESGEWKNCVIYQGLGRFTDKMTIFCKDQFDFINEFEYIGIYTDKPFRTWMEDVYAQLDCCATDSFKREFPFNIFQYTKKEIDNNIEYFLECYWKGLSQYKALLLMNYEKI